MTLTTAPQPPKLKIVLVGDLSVGKTSIVKFFNSSHFSDQYQPTIGAGYFTRQLKINNETVIIDIWDTAGQEIYRSLVPQYARNSDGAIIVYDITSRSSFESIERWKSFINDIGNMQILIFANKNDLEDERVIDFNEGFERATFYNCLFVEGNAKNGKNIDQAFTILCKKCIEAKADAMDNVILSIPIENTIRTNNTCC